MSDLINRQEAIDAMNEVYCRIEMIKNRPVNKIEQAMYLDMIGAVRSVPSAQPERLTDDDFETIRIHLLATKEKLCNHHRWKEAEEYQRIIDRFMAFASAPTIRINYGK